MSLVPLIKNKIAQLMAAVGRTFKPKKDCFQVPQKLYRQIAVGVTLSGSWLFLKVHPAWKRPSYSSMPTHPCFASGRGMGFHVLCQLHSPSPPTPPPPPPDSAVLSHGPSDLPDTQAPAHRCPLLTHPLHSISCWVLLMPFFRSGTIHDSLVFIHPHPVISPCLSL